MTSLIQSTISSRTSEYLKSTYSDRQILDIAKQELPTLSKKPEKLSEIIKPKTIESFTYKANREVPLETNKKTTAIEENPIKLEEATRPNIVNRNVLSETDKKTLVLEVDAPKPEEIPVESEKKSGIISSGGWLGFWISLWKKTCPSWSDGREKKLIARFLELHQFTADGLLSDMDSVSTHGVPIKYMLDDKEKNLIAKHFPDHNNYDISRSQANKYKNTRSVLSSDFDDPIKTKFNSIDSMENLNKIYNLYTDIMEKTHYSHSINKIIKQMIDFFQNKISDQHRQIIEQ